MSHCVLIHLGVSHASYSPPQGVPLADRERPHPQRSFPQLPHLWGCALRGHGAEAHHMCLQREKALTSGKRTSYHGLLTTLPQASTMMLCCCTFSQWFGPHQHSRETAKWAGPEPHATEEPRAGVHEYLGGGAEGRLQIHTLGFWGLLACWNRGCGSWACFWLPPLLHTALLTYAGWHSCPPTP